MLISKMWNYFNGYVIIKITGFSLEKFLNLMIRKEVFIWDVHRQSNTILYAKVNKRDFKNLKNIVKNTSCKVEIIEKSGLPFLFIKFKKRKLLIAGAFLTLVLIYLLTSFIWVIEIVGNESIDSKILLRQLEEQGIKKGRFKYQIDKEEIEEKLLLNEEIAYIRIDFNGTKARIEVIEKEKPPSMVNNEILTQVIAKKDGIIHKMFVYGGEAVVEEGQLVNKGDLLISGELRIEGQEEILQRVKATGDVYGRTWYERIKDISTKVNSIHNPKEKIVEKVLVIGSLEKTIKKANIPYEEYDKVEKTTSLISFGKIQLPFSIKQIEYYPVKEELKLTEKDIKKRALKIIKKEIEKESKEKIEIINSSVEILKKEKNTVKVKVFIEAIEKISIVEEIKR